MVTQVEQGVLVMDGMGSLSSDPRQATIDLKLSEEAMLVWLNTLMVREQGSRLKRNILAEAVHNVVDVEVTQTAVLESAACPSSATTQPEPFRSRWQRWLRRLSPRHRAIDEVRKMARAIGQDFDEAKAERFIQHVRSKNRGARRDRIRAMRRAIAQLFTPHPQK
jgi:hypothetical protein